MRNFSAALLGATLALGGCGADPTTVAVTGQRSDTRSLPVIPAMAMPAPEPAAGVAAPMLPELPKLSPAQVAAETGLLRTALAAEVPHLLSLSADDKRALIAQAQAAATAADLIIDRPQLVVVVDRNPRVQALMVVVANPNAAWEVIGGTRVSTGQPDRKLYYVTPTGVFLHTADILDFRAEGTFNENHIRGYGLKGMRIWDFGWQWATKGWRSDGERGQIRLQMHATDPQYLEQRLGRPASEGCVRVPAALNRFLDRHGVLDVDYEQQAAQDIRYRSVLLPDRRPSPLAGHTLIVVDSGGHAA
jgi:lipoprotein-anchoring transpeptidase ErfK/SrfK